MRRAGKYLPPAPELGHGVPRAEGLLNHIHLDLEDINQLGEQLPEIKARLGGRLDALVNNAGISPKGSGGERLGFSTAITPHGSRCSTSICSLPRCWRAGC